MKRLLLLGMVLFLITGCTKVNTDLQTDLEQKLSAVNAEVASRPYYNHTYYSYHIDPSIGRIESDKTSNVFSYQGAKFIMNLNIPAVLDSTSSHTSEITIDTSHLLASYESEYTDYVSQSHHYSIQVYGNSDYAVIMCKTTYMDFYSVCTVSEVSSMSAMMIDIARSIKINRTKILEEYASKATITYHRSELELFQNIVPENGVIEELFETDDMNGNEEIDYGDGVDGNYNATSAPMITSTPDQIVEEDLNN